MSKYTVKGTTILHNGTAYGEGAVVEMTDKQAKRLSKFLTLVKETQPKQAPVKAAPKANTAKTAAKNAAEAKDGTEKGQDVTATDNGGSKDDK